MSSQITITVEMARIDCWACGFAYAVPMEFRDRRRRDGRDFWCPGCGRSACFKECEIDQLKRKVASAQQRAEYWCDQHTRAVAQCEAEERRHRATKGVLTKTRKRVGHGVCPCCNRSFANLRRHMANKHPEYSET